MAKQQTLTTIITLKDQNFKDGLNRAKQGLDQFKKQGGAVNSFLTGIFAGMGISVANLALTMVKKIGEGVNKTIHETQRMGDAWDNTVNTMKNVWQQYTRDLAMGTGLQSMQSYIDKAYELSKAMDNLGTSDIYDKSLYGFYKSKGDVYAADARDTTKSVESREYSRNKANEFYAEAQSHINDNLNAVIGAFTATIATCNVGLDGLAKTVRNTTDAAVLMEDIAAQQKAPGSGANKINSMLDSGAFDNQFQAWLRKVVNFEATGHGFNNQELENQLGGFLGSFAGGPQMKKVIDDLKKQGYSQQEINNMVNEWKTSQLNDALGKVLTELFSRMQQGETELAGVKRAQNKLNSLKIKDETTESGSTKTTYVAKAPKVEEPVEVDVTFSRQSLDEEFNAIQDRITELVKTYNETGEFNLSEYERLDEELGKLQEKYEVLKSLDMPQVMEDTAEAVSDTTSVLNEQNDVLAERIRLLEAQTENTALYGETIGYLGDIFGSLSEIVGDDEPFRAFLSNISTMISGVQSLIQVYTSLLSVKAVEESIAAGEGIPGPYKLIAIAAAAATILGVIATMKSKTANLKFAEGGIVPGSSWSGDNVVIRVNSGEAVLNREQQSRLFRILDGGGIGASAKSNVEFVIKGDTLVGAINNHNKIRNF